MNPKNKDSRRAANGKADQKIVPSRPRIPSWRGLCADSGEKREPASDIDTATVVSLKALDLNRPIREADVGGRLRSADTVAKVENCRATNFSRNYEAGSHRRPVQNDFLQQYLPIPDMASCWIRPHVRVEGCCRHRLIRRSS
jgi:hypothetical protein